MRSCVPAVFLLAMVSLRVRAAERQNTGLRASSEQNIDGAKVKDRRLDRDSSSDDVTPNKGRRRPSKRCEDDCETTAARYTAPTPEAPSPTPEPSEPSLVPQPSPAPLMPPTDFPTDMEVMLDLHNEARCLHNADPLTYNEDVATSAMAHAQTLSSNCGSNDHNGGEDRNGYGENVFLCWGDGATSCYTPEMAMTSLYESEIQVDTVDKYGEHATQILWKSTTEMGCAVETCDLDSSVYEYLVCHYNPAGNVLGKLEEEVELPSGDFC